MLNYSETEKKEMLNKASRHWPRPFAGEGPYSLSQVSNYINCTEQILIQKEYSCTVVIPVYNGLHHLKRLIPSLIRNTPGQVQIVVINDCSPDASVGEYVKQTAEKHSNWIYMENEENLGFVASVNHAMSAVTTDYAILLNSDTEVPSHWIERMLAPFYGSKNVATTTPFTNSGVLFSFPNYMVDNLVTRDIEELNEAFRCIVPDEYILNETYSGTGFCMGINMECWDQIGPLDYKNYGKGYGEENDWCFRALQAGWRHLLVPNLFVCHYHGGSFLSEEKQQLCDEHQVILRETYPEYMEFDVPTFQGTNPWLIYREAAALLLCRKKALLFIDVKISKDGVSGASDYANCTLEELKNTGTHEIIIARFLPATTIWELVPYSVTPDISIPLDDVADLEILFDLVNIENVIINNFAFCENTEKAIDTLIKLKKAKQQSLSISYHFHDSLCICPSFFLLNKEDLPCTPCEYEICQACIKENNNRAVNRVGVRSWRRKFRELFIYVDSFVAFSLYSKSIILRIYPEINSRIHVIPHNPLLSNNAAPFHQPHEIEEFRIAFVGTFNTSKGSSYFTDMAATFKKSGIPASFYLAGINESRHPLKHIILLGRYERDKLGEVLSNNEINLVISPSIANETFSYVAQELMMLNVPIVVFPCGAPQERIRNTGYELGEVAEEVSLESLCEATIHLIDRLFIQQRGYADLSDSLKDQLSHIREKELEYERPSQMLLQEEPNSDESESTPPEPTPVSYGITSYYSMQQQPPYGLKQAICIWVNKKVPFLFRKTAATFPPQVRGIGVIDAFKIVLIKKLIK